MAPLHQTRATTDLLLEIGRRLMTPVDLGWQTFEEMLAATFTTLPPAAEGGDAWAEAQEQGGWWGALPAGMAVARTGQSAAAGPGFDPGAVAARLDGDASQYPLQLIAYPSSMFLDGSLAHLPWMQETPDPMTSAMWSSWVEINPATAEKMGVATGDLVDVASAHGSLRTAAVVTPGIAPGVVAMPMGQGHTMFTRYATGRGENPAKLLSGRAWAATRVKVSRAGDPDGRLILFAGGDRDHDGAHEYGHAGRG
jgi:anaerobic selenocysteine-containing dehydrogenase